jgi:putative DNA primase/helicase
VRALGPDERIPEIERLVDVPVLARDGSLIAKPGYDADSRLYYQPVPELLGLDLPTSLTADDVAEACQLLRVELLGDFPFLGLADEANALAAMLMPFLRDCIEGATPFHMVDKPAPGTGAGLLADAIAIPALGASPPSKQWSGREDEVRKGLLSLLATGASVVKLDNLTGTINAPSLNSAITEDSYADRVLGSNHIASYPVRCLWLGTANNARLGGDFRTRVVPIRLDAKVEEPRRRAGPREGETWRHPNLRQWTKQHRVDLVRACLIVCQAWVEAGMPRIQPETALGSFEGYAAVMNGVLTTAGVEGFLANLHTLQDDETAEMAALFQKWVVVYGNDELSARGLVKDGKLRHEFDAAGASTTDQRSLGTWLGNRRDRVYGELVLRRRVHTGTNHWRVVPVG